MPRHPAGGHRDWTAFADARVAGWRAFAEVATDYDFTVIPESALLQGPVYRMLSRDADPAVIEAFIHRLVDAAAPLRPTLVYLDRRDRRSAFRAIGERRGMAWLLHHIQASTAFAFTRARGLSGLDGLLAFWEAHAELCSTIVEQLALPRLVLEGGPGDWQARRRPSATSSGWRSRTTRPSSLRTSPG